MPRFVAPNGKIPYIVCMNATVPDQNRLFEIAASQQGLFTVPQAAEAGYSSHLLLYHARAGNLQRVQRGIYRLARFPAGEHEDLVSLWLWSRRQGVFSHVTALSLHGLSDAMPASVDMTLQLAARGRRQIVPDKLRLHFADLAQSERAWVGTVPVTSALRTIADCVSSHVAADLVQQAASQAVARGLAAPDAVRAILQETV